MTIFVHNGKSFACKVAPIFFAVHSPLKHLGTNMDTTVQSRFAAVLHANSGNLSIAWEFLLISFLLPRS